MPCLGIGVISAVFQTSGNVEAKREALMIDENKREYDQQAVLKDSSWHLVNPRSLIRRHCVYDVRDLFTINMIKCKLLTSNSIGKEFLPIRVHH